MSDNIGTLVTADSSEDVPSASSQNCHENCLPGESDCIPVTPAAGRFADKVQSDMTSPMNASATSVRCLDHIRPSVDGELQPGAPIVALGGANEEELKRGLEQRLGLVLSKLARESEDDDQRWSAVITSDDVAGNDDVANEALSDVESTDTSDLCYDIHHILLMDIVQEMDEVERYSYLSFVAYAMHQLFEYSAWNEYVVFHLLTVCFCIFLLLFMLPDWWGAGVVFCLGRLGLVYGPADATTTHCLWLQ